MWTKTQNGENVKPPAVSVDQSGVIIRKNYHAVEATEDMPSHWEYEEWQMTSEQYELYQTMAAETADLEDALIELAELIVGGE